MMVLIWIHHTCPSLQKRMDSTLSGSIVIIDGSHMDSSSHVYNDSTQVVHT